MDYEKPPEFRPEAISGTFCANKPAVYKLAEAYEGGLPMDDPSILPLFRNRECVVLSSRQGNIVGYVLNRETIKGARGSLEVLEIAREPNGVATLFCIRGLLPPGIQASDQKQKARFAQVLKVPVKNG